MAESFVQVAIDGAGKKIRNFLNNIAGVDVYQQAVTLTKSDGTIIDDPSRASVTQPISAASLPLPASAAQEHTTAASPHAARLTDGAAFYKSTTPADTQPISAASLPLPTGAALDATLTGGTQKAIVRGGAKGATAAADVTGTAEGADHQGLDVQIYHGGTAKDPTAIRALTSADVVTTAPPANASENVAQFGGTNVATGTGAGGAGIPRMTVSNDSSLIVSAGDVDHDAANTLKNLQVAGNANPVDVPPTAVSANGDRVRAWYDRYGSPVIRTRKIRESYTAVFRLAEAAARLDQTFTHTANTNKQWATLHHLVGATKEVRLQSCVVWITSAITVAPQGILELRQISAAPATGNPAITPTPHRRGGTAAEAVALYLPTTAGTEANVDRPLGHHVFDEAVSVATTAMAHPQGFGRGGIVLYDRSLDDDELMQPVLPVATLDGWAVTTRLTGATVMRLTVVMKFTEEIP